MRRYLPLAIGVALTVCVTSMAQDDVVPLTRIRIIETELPFDVEVLSYEDLDVEVRSNTVDGLVVYLPSNQVYIRPLPPANGNNSEVLYSRFEELAPHGWAAADPFNSGGGPTNVNSASRTTNPRFPKLGTDGFLWVGVNEDCPNCK